MSAPAPTAPTTSAHPTANRIDETFAALRRGGRKAFIPFLIGGLPDPAAMVPLLRDLQSAGASLVEIGFPYSDPIADGPVIQAGYNDALRKGVTAATVLGVVHSARAAGVTVPLVGMVSYSIIHRRGPERFAADSAAAGLDGLIVPDLPVDEAEAMAAVAAGAGLRLILLVAPTTPPDRRKRIAATATGFIYCLSVAGITGERTQLPADLSANVKALKAETDKPVCVGFGISRPEHVAAAAAASDGVIVGSALVKRLAAEGPASAVALAKELIAALPSR
jgi:tryptophan synthase alpha chain